jgi:hypothetical protein
MANDPPMQVYPDPDGTKDSANYVPVNGPVAMGSIGSGLASVAAAGLGTGMAGQMTPGFLQAAQYQGPVDAAIRLVTAVPIEYVAASIGFGVLSVGLAVWNLVHGYRMRSRLEQLSRDVSLQCTKLIDDFKKKAA